MAGFLAKGQRFLARVREESLVTELTATLYRGGDSLGEIVGLVFASATEAIDSNQVVYVDVQRQDFIVPIASYDDLASSVPQAGDLIVVDRDGVETSYELMTLGGIPAWEPHDAEAGTAYRLHTAIIEVA